jgi:hypothetical protein
MSYGRPEPKFPFLKNELTFQFQKVNLFVIPLLKVSINIE